MKLQLDSFLLEAAVDLFLQALDGKKSKSLTLSPEKDLLRIGEELRIINRKSSKRFKDSIIFHDDQSQISIQGNPEQFQVDRIETAGNENNVCRDEVKLLLPIHQSYHIRYLMEGDRFHTQKKHAVDVLRGLSIPVHERDRVIGIFPQASTGASSRVASLLLYPKKDPETNEYFLSLHSPIDDSSDREQIACKFKWIHCPKQISLSILEE